MPQELSLLLGGAADLFKGHPVGIPMAVSFLPTRRRWVQRRDRFEHIAEPADDSDDISIKPLYLDPWEVRSQFLRLRLGTDDAVAFLSDSGEFHSALGSGRLTNRSLFEIQGIVYYLLTTPPPRWKAKPEVFKTDSLYRLLRSEYQTFTVRFSWSKNSHAAVIETRTTLDAMMATVFVDHIRDARIGFCSRPDCRKQFEHGSNHARKYCSYDCAHLMSVRMKRERDRATAPRRPRGRPAK